MTTERASDEAKASVYRAYLDGEATLSDVEVVFGAEMDTFFQRLRFLSVIQSTPTNTPDATLVE